MIRLAVVEDDNSDQKRILDCIKQYSQEHQVHIEHRFFDDGLDFTEQYDFSWDIVFMDIRLKLMDGIEAARAIREKDPAVIIIFLTSMAKFAIKGYEVDALDFLIKPIHYGEFESRMMKASSLLNRRSRHKSLLLPAADGKVLVSTDDIYFIEIRNHNAHFVKAEGTHVKRDSLSRLEDELKPYHFVRCNNSYLVNLKHITRLSGDVLEMGEYRVPVSRNRKQDFLAELGKYIEGGYR